MHRVDPRNIDANMVRDVVHGMNTLRPWNYPRAETGSYLNHAVRFRAHFASKTEYLRSIWHARLGGQQYTVKAFLYTFPKLPKNATKGQICEFLNRVCRHSVGFAVYVPPFPTMTHENHTGLWYPDLPPHCHMYWEFYDQTLQQALAGSPANLSDSELTRHLVSEFSGYQILWLLANIAGHPGVAIDVVQPSMPRQRRDMSFHDYMQAWSHFLHIEHCRGVTYSDVYFVEKWLEYLHSSFNDTLKPLLFGLLRDCPRNVPVPIHFSPEHLIHYVCARAHTVGLYSLTAAATPATSTSSSSRRQLTSNVRQIGHVDPPLVDVRLLDESLPDDIFATVCSLVANNTSGRCDLCNDDKHLMASCPILHKVISDPVKTRRLLSALDRRSSRGGPTQTPPNSRSSGARTPPTSNRTAPTRALDLNDDDTVEDAEVCQLTDDDATVDTENNSPDF